MWIWSYIFAMTFDYELHYFNRYRCDRQPPRWPPVVLTSWCWQLCVVSSNIVPELVCVTNNTLQIWWNATYETIIKDYHFCLCLFIGSFTMGKARSYTVRTLRQLWTRPTWQVIEDFCQQPLGNRTANNYVNEHRSEFFSLVKPWDVETLTGNLTSILWKRTTQLNYPWVLFPHPPHFLESLVCVFIF